MTPYLFDTIVISALVHHRAGFRQAAERLDALPVERRLVSAIPLAELETMIAKAQHQNAKFAKVRLILAHFNLLDFGGAAALHVGRIRAFLEPRGWAIGPMGTLIAAHACSMGAAVVTANVRDFSRAPDLRVENWLN